MSETDKAAERKARLAAALRQNLRRRKTEARAGAADAAPDRAAETQNRDL